MPDEPSNYRAELFASYGRRTAELDENDESKLAWFASYVRANYLPHLKQLDPGTAEVLEIGCNKGYLLAALKAAGFHCLQGIDLSPDDLRIARKLVPGVDFQDADGFDYLAVRPQRYDLIIVKAVLEHVPKDRVLPLLGLTASALKPRGMLVLDVPNMDWLFASHERYMDFTHEVGFTKESLRQILGTVFPRVDVIPVDAVVSGGLGAIRRRLARRLLGMLLRWADPEGGANPVWARSLIGLGRR
jgi:SAM-dependent methyltransferase